MKTTVKTSVPERRLLTGSSYLLQHLDNEDELLGMIRKAEMELRPCAQCGHPKPSIRYEFYPETEEPHRFHAWCCGREDNVLDAQGVPMIGCWMRTFEYRAVDETDDIKYTLDIIVSKWNRRPGEPYP